MSGETERKANIGDGVEDNSEKTIPNANTSVTYHFADSGNDDATNVYFGFGRPAYRVQITPDKTVTIENYNGKVYKDPVVVTSNGAVLKNIYRTLVIKTTQATTQLKVYAK